MDQPLSISHDDFECTRAMIGWEDALPRSDAEFYSHQGWQAILSPCRMCSGNYDHVEGYPSSTIFILLFRHWSVFIVKSTFYPSHRISIFGILKIMFYSSHRILIFSDWKWVVKLDWRWKWIRVKDGWRLIWGVGFGMSEIIVGWEDVCTDHMQDVLG